jgi:hypothetical protein
MRIRFALLTVALVTIGCALPAQAGPQDQDGPPAAETPESRGVARAVVVAHLVDWARTNRDAEALLTASRMLAEVPMRAGTDGDAGLEPSLTPQALRQEAATLQDRPVEDVVVTGSRVRQPPDAAEESPAPPLPIQPPAPITRPAPAPAVPAPSPPPAPIVGVRASPFGVGPISTVKRLSSRESWSFVVDARGAQLLRVAAIGDGDTNIDLIVRNDQGDVLCADGLDDHYPSCTLSPAAPTRLRINVVNRGDVWTKVQVLTN